MKVVVVMNVFRGHEDLFKDFTDEFVFRYDGSVSGEDLKDADVLIGNVDLALLKEAKQLKYVHWGMAGSDGAANELKERNIILTNSTGAFSVSIAEHMIGMVLHFFKKFHLYTRNQAKRYYHKEGETRSILNSKVLIIGFGSIGQEFAKRMHALGAEVTGIKRTAGTKPEYLDALYTVEHLDECLAGKDIVAMCLPQNKDTVKMMSRERLARLSDHTLLVNVGRGTAIDTEALIDELKNGRIEAALDVYEKEPLSEESPLWDLENCLVLPHITGNDSLAYTRGLLRQYAVENLAAFEEGKPLRNVVDFATGYKVSNS